MVGLPPPTPPTRTLRRTARYEQLRLPWSAWGGWGVGHAWHAGARQGVGAHAALERPSSVHQLGCPGAAAAAWRFCRAAARIAAQVLAKWGMLAQHTRGAKAGRGLNQGRRVRGCSSGKGLLQWRSPGWRAGRSNPGELRAGIGFLQSSHPIIAESRCRAGQSHASPT